MTQADILKSIRKHPGKVARELQNFTDSAQALSMNHPWLIDQFPDRWVAIFDGEVRADGESVEAVLSALEAEGIGSEKAIIRYISTSDRTLFF